MFYLILAIFSSAMVSILMRLSEGKVKNDRAMLVVNYAVCSILAGIYAGGQLLEVGPGLHLTAGFGVVNGILYLVSFVLLQVNVQRNGVVLSSTFMKLGLLVTLGVSVVIYGETPTFYQGLGFLLAVGAIILINSRGQKQTGSFRMGLIWLLLCGGMADAMSKIFEESGVPGLGDSFLFFTFLTAGVLCAVMTAVKDRRFGKTEVIFGLLVGIPNFFSSKFLLRSLSEIAAVVAFPAYSVGGILVVTLAGVLVFRERLAKRQWVALGLILLALVLLNL